MVGCLYPSAGQENVWDVHILYSPRLGQPSHLNFDGKHVFVQNFDACARRSVFSVVQQHLFAGYYFGEDVPKSVRNNRDVWRSGVREFVCEKTPFFSEDLKECFECVAALLANTPAVEQKKSFFACKLLRAKDLKERVYPEGYTRQWRVVSAKYAMKRHLFKNRVCVLLKNHSEALEGVLIKLPRATSWIPGRTPRGHFKPLMEAETPQNRSLFILKIPDKVRKKDMTRVEGVPRMCDLLNPHSITQYNVGFIFFPQAGMRCGALMDASHVNCLDDFDVSRRLLDVLKNEILKGFVLKRGEKSLEKNIGVLRLCDVREVACRRRQFVSRVLDDFVRSLPTYLSEFGIDWRQSDETGNGRVNLRTMFSRFKKIVWSVRDACDVVGVRRLEQPRNSIALFVQGESVVLTGTPVLRCRYVGLSDSLWTYAS